jgi:hypothetical protein
MVRRGGVLRWHHRVVLKALAVLAAGVAAGALFVVLRPDDAGESGATPTMTAPEGETTTAETQAGETGGGTPVQPSVQRINIDIRGGQPVGGVARLEVERGQRIQLVVTSNVADHVHVHGHDLFADVGPGQPARIRFRATIPGRIEVELEDRHVPILELTVTP